MGGLELPNTNKLDLPVFVAPRLLLVLAEPNTALRRALGGRFESTCKYLFSPIF